MHKRPCAAWLLLAAFVLAACAGGLPGAPGGAPSPQAPGASPVSEPANGGAEPVTIGFAAPEFERGAYQPLIDAFNSENPDVQVRFVSLDEVGMPRGGDFDPAEVLRETVSAADTAAPFFVRAEDLASGLLLDLAPLMDADPSFDRDDFYPGAFEAASLDGAVYVLPRTIGVPLLAYNRDLFDAAGLATPTPDWTWEDFLGAAERLASKRGDEVDVYGFVAPDAGLMALYGALAAADDPLAVGEEVARLDRPEVAAALERIEQLFDSGGLFAAEQEGPQGFGRMQELISSGRAAMWPDGLLVTRPGSAPEVNSGLAPLPEPALPGGASVETNGYVISSGTQHPREAWRWLSFLSRQEIRRPGNVVLIGGGRTLPARKSLAEQSGFWNGLDAEATAAIEAGLARRAAAGRARAHDVPLRQALAGALQAVLGGAEPSQALVEAQATFEQRLAEVEPTPTPGPPVAVSVPEPDVAPAGATTVTFMAPGFDTAQLRELAREFNRENGSVYVDVQGGFMEGPLNAARVAEQADCFMLPIPPQAGDPLTSTLDLRPLLDAEVAAGGEALIDDYPAALLAPFERDGALRGLPYGATLRAVTYNQDAFEAAGLEPPRADWTLDDFLQAAQTLTTGTDERDKTYGFASAGIGTEDLRFFLDRAGVRLTEGSGDTLRPALTEEPVVQAVRYFIDLLQNTSPHTELSGYSRSEPFVVGAALELIETGRVGMWFDFGPGLVRIRIGGPERPAFTRAIAPPPLGEGGVTANDVRVSGMFISAGSAAPDACWAWLKRLSATTSLLQGAFPARRSLAEAPEFQAQARPGAAEVYAAYREALERPPVQSEESGALALDPYWFYRAVDRALQGASLELELEQAQELSEQFLECVRGGGGRAECAQAVDPEYSGFAGP
ncbi:MAG: extracellular solute-binding protein [Chloroflexota bacterium]|nr:MAG: ABC transporter substrate-binding protein [Chloroflexota bacterium]